MIVTTTNSVDGKIIAEYLGVVGANTETPKLNAPAGTRIGFGGALNQIKEQATKMGGDAVVGLQVVGATEQIYGTVHLYGTVVKFK